MLQYAAINIIYSGTVSAAREAAIMDVPAIAVSVASHTAKHFDFAAKFSAKLSQIVVNKGLPNGTLLNVNVPDLPENELAGVLVTYQGKSKWDDIYEERIDPYGNKYYWLTGKLEETDESSIRLMAKLDPVHISTPLPYRKATRLLYLTAYTLWSRGRRVEWR